MLMSFINLAIASDFHDLSDKITAGDHEGLDKSLALNSRSDCPLVLNFQPQVSAVSPTINEAI